MVSAETALRTILDSINPVRTETIYFATASGRILATNVAAPEDVPAFDNSAMDGFAVRASDLSETSAKKPSDLRVIGESSAGHPWAGELPPGAAVRIMTGAVIPLGADTVVPIEDVQSSNATNIRVLGAPRMHKHIRKRGEEMRAGSHVFSSGTIIGPSQLGVLASLGCTKIEVFERPIVTIIPTGDELVDPEDKPAPGQIRNSSSFVLSAFASADGCETNTHDIVCDQKTKIAKAISNSLSSDVVLVTGGVSVGRYDHVPKVLEELGAEILFSKVNIKPGKPLLFARLHSTLIFGLPGNPVSTTVSYIQFVRPALHRLTGREFKPPLRISARLEHELVKSDNRRHFLRAILEEQNEELFVRTTGPQGSGMLSSVTKANCFIVIPEKEVSFKRGDVVEVELIQ